MKYEIFLDMDGVLMDYDGHIKSRLTPWTGRTYHHLPRDQWTAEEHANDLHYQRVMAHPEFWQSMPPMADARELWEFCQDHPHHIMTATPAPAGAVYRARCAADKFCSILNHFNADFPAWRFNAVLRSDKAGYAASHRILVDDMEANCEEWRKAGGIAILHTSAAETIKQLKEIIMRSNRPIGPNTPIGLAETHEDITKIFKDNMKGPSLNLLHKLRDKTSAERKAEPIHSGVLLYFPDAAAAISRVSKKGNDKHNPGEPLHWARHKSTDQLDCLIRHSLTPDKIDPETGEVEAAAMVWRGLAQLQLIEEKRLIAAGIMPYSGVTS